MLARLFSWIFRAKAIRQDPRGYAVGTLAARTLGGGPLALLAVLAWRNRARLAAWLRGRRHAPMRADDGEIYA